MDYSREPFRNFRTKSQPRLLMFKERYIECEDNSRDRAKRRPRPRITPVTANNHLQSQKASTQFGSEKREEELMGSLMAGWDANIKDPKDVMLQRNKSLTKEEIAAYWRTVKKPEEGNQNDNQENNTHKVSMKSMQRSNSLPLTDRKESSVNNGSKKEDEKKMSKTSCWWTRSNWAFLNEPPVIATDGPRKYAAQFNAANFGSSNTSSKAA